MKNLLIAFLFGLSITAVGQTPATASAQGNTNVPSQAGALRVNSPKANETISQNFVHVTYQLVNRGADAATSPNFSVQLDGNDPVTTTAADYTFTGLTPGAHTVTVTLVDANGLPIGNSAVATKFTVLEANRNGAPTSLYQSGSPVQLASTGGSTLPEASTPLPMLSLVGFIVLVGGICTAIRAH
jgi:hypothetical protein